METLLNVSKGLFSLAQTRVFISLHIIKTHSGSYLTFSYDCFLLFASVGTPEKITSTVCNVILRKTNVKYEMFTKIFCFKLNHFFIMIQLNYVLKILRSNGEVFTFKRFLFLLTTQLP
jgi:hypothetical protein